MIIRLHSIVLTLLICLAAHPAWAASSLVVPVNRSELLVLPQEVDEVVVADPNVADIYVHGQTRISVIGKALGRTSLRVFDTDGEMLRDIVVIVSYDLPEIRRALKNFFPNEDIGVEMVNDNVAITGNITDGIIAKQAISIVEEYVNEDRLSAEEKPRVINLAKIRSGQQVMLRVRVGEIQRNALRKLGVNFNGSRSVGSFDFFFQTATTIADQFGILGGSYSSGQSSLGLQLDALEQDGIFKVLAEPNLVAISGEKAEFLAGGEFPIPIAQDNNTITLEFKEFGVATQFTPFVLSENRIRLIVQPEVSELSDTGSIQLQNIVVPGLTSRRVKTTVELAPGESFMIAGLISDRMNTTVKEIPGIAEVPILSAMFRTTQYERIETELIMAVTPYLVDPVTSKDIRNPAEHYRNPSLMESFFYGSIGGNASEHASRIAQTPSLEGPVGFMMD